MCGCPSAPCCLLLPHTPKSLPTPTPPPPPWTPPLLTPLLRQGLSADSPACQRAAAALEDYDFSKEGTLEDRCTEAFAAVQHFEKTHCLALQARGACPSTPLACVPSQLAVGLDQAALQRADRTLQLLTGSCQAADRMAGSAAPSTGTGMAAATLHTPCKSCNRAMVLIYSQQSFGQCGNGAFHAAPWTAADGGHPMTSTSATLLSACGLQNMSFAYLQRRPELVNTTMTFAQQLLMKDEVAHDAILLMDRTMSTSLQVGTKPQTLNPEVAVHLLAW